MTSARGFTLVEMLVSTAILLIILSILFTFIQTASTVLQSSNGDIKSFQGARDAFATMTRNISLACLNNYYDYANSSYQTLAQTGNSSTFTPTGCILCSDLHFVSGKSLVSTSNASTLPFQQVTHSIFFQAPLGYSANTNYRMLNNLLNACGYYVSYNQDTAPSFLPPTSTLWRYQLMEFIEPTENLSVYGTSLTAGTEYNWFLNDLNPSVNPSPNTHPIANNIIALVVQPKASESITTGTNPAAIAPNYEYDSRKGAPPSYNPPPLNLLPPVVEVVMVAIDEASVRRLGANQSTVITTALNGLFVSGGGGSTPTQVQQDDQLQKDLQTLETNLTTDHINYHVFQTQVVLHNAQTAWVAPP